MQIRKIDTNHNPNFQRLYMPARKTLNKYGVDFARNAEKQRAVLKDYAQNYDIYLIPRVKNEDVDLLQDIWESTGKSMEEFWEFMPKASYFNLHVAPRFPRKYTDLETRNTFDNIYSAFGVEASNLVETFERILSEKEVVKNLNEKTKYYNSFS